MKKQYIIVSNGKPHTTREYVMADLHWKGYSSALPEDFAMIEPEGSGWRENNYDGVPQAAMEKAKEIAADGEERILVIQGENIVEDVHLQKARGSIIRKLPDWDY